MMILSLKLRWKEIGSSSRCREVFQIQKQQARIWNGKSPIVFFEDGNFLKSRETEGSVVELTGTYSFNEDPRSLELTYGEESEIIGSCQSDLKENLFFSSNDVLSSTWNQCDGPSLDYEKI